MIDVLYIVRVYEDGDVFEYEYGNIRHAKEQFELECKADIIEYDKGEEKTIISKRQLVKEK